MTLRLATAQPARHPNPTVKAIALTHLMFERPDLDRTEAFLRDFGLRTTLRTPDELYLRGTAPAAYCYRARRARQARFVGMGFAVASRQDLLKLSRLPGASPIVRADRPGGGEMLTLVDPSGFTVEIVWNQQPADVLPHRALLTWNVGRAVARVDAFQRLPAEPPEVLRLGHVVLELADFQATSAWYTQHLGLIPSDVQVLPDGSPAVAFMRLDLGDTPADHHTLALAQGFMPLYSHSAYEVVDTDAVGMGQRVLRERGWKHAWGMGRHILGSQIFDYWQDPWGDKHEHYCDGDLLTAGLRTGIHPVSRDAMSQWGPPMPASFTRPRMTPAALGALLRNLRRSPDLTFDKLLTLAKLFG
ncbi:MAG: glyoxalase [Aquabacterium sp.]|jgi:catechol 2,3-dioxygenase-like lactoylglutathione lyase family enzyme|nr:MAG: glyoxalase [Aquabacterium sp.]